jgi:hypothetical protein
MYRAIKAKKADGGGKRVDEVDVHHVFENRGNCHESE